jgi:tetratricopeptide (TPR) repeat protein
VIRTALILYLAFFYPAWQVASPQAAEHMQAGIAAEKARNFDAAIAEYKQVTELDPKFTDGFVGLGQAYMEKGDYGSAIAPLKHAVELDADSAPAHQLLGYSLLAQGYASEAIPHLKRSTDTTTLGIAEVQAGQLTEAVRDLEVARNAHPNDPDILYYLGRASGLLAKQSIDTLMAAYPDSARAHQAMAENYFVLRRTQDAEKEYLDALRLRPGLPEAHLALGEVYADAAQWTKAEEQFRLQVKAQPGNAEATYRLGESLLEQGKAHEARPELVRADKLMPEMPETLYALGKADSLDGEPDAAVKAWTKLLSIEKQSSLAAQAHFGLAAIYRKQGKMAEAKQEMAEFENLHAATAPQP